MKIVSKVFGVGSAHGKFGELLQGVLPGENANFLVTLPILRYSFAKFYCDNLNKGMTVYPPHKTKSAKLVQKILEYFKLSFGWTLIIDSKLEEGKGLGGSTADMVATVRAITHAIGKILPTEVFLQFLKEIEPSDGIMYEGIVCFYHRNVALHSQLGYLPEAMVVGVDEGGSIDTIKFNQDLRPYSVEEKVVYVQLLHDMISAIKKNELKQIGNIATTSAILNQDINPKKNLHFLIDLCNTVKGLGVVVAHSGTYIGIILDKTDPDYVNKLSFIEKSMKNNFLKPERFNTFSKKIEYPLQTEIQFGAENVC